MARRYRGRVENRDAIGSWQSEPGAATGIGGAGLDYRGERLGLPESGTGSIAPIGRRFGALFVDWSLCLLIAYGLLARGDQQNLGNWTLAVFVVLNVLTVGTVGATPGKRLFGLRVIAADGKRLSVPRVVVRTALLAVVFPAVIWDRDSRGLHDRLSGAVQLRA
jgi:uncharacterized RDD family membrane protein YckC